MKTVMQDGRFVTNSGRALNLATSAPTLKEVQEKIAEALAHAEAGKTVQDTG